MGGVTKDVCVSASKEANKYRVRDKVADVYQMK